MVAVRHRLRFPRGRSATRASHTPLKHFFRDSDVLVKILSPIVSENAVSRYGIAQAFQDFDLLRQALFKIRVIRANGLLIALATPAKILLQHCRYRLRALSPCWRTSPLY